MTFEEWFDKNYPVATFTNTSGAAMIPMRNAFREVAERSWNMAQVKCGTAELLIALKKMTDWAQKPCVSIADAEDFEDEVRAARALAKKFGG